jgi:hypothetical protein
MPITHNIIFLGIEFVRLVGSEIFIRDISEIDIIIFVIALNHYLLININY